MEEKNNVEIDAKNHVEVVQLWAGNRALWKIANKYLGLLGASIFAIVLAKPELAKEIQLLRIPLSKIVQGYLTIGFLGLFFAEIKNSLEEAADKKFEYLSFMQKIVILYMFFGIVIFYALLSGLLK